MSEEEKKCTTSCCPYKRDLRTFFIALLTTLIVLAVYHTGKTMCRMCRRAKAPCPPPITRQCMPGMNCGMPCHAPCCHRMRPQCGGKHFRKDFMRRHPRRNRPAFPVKVQNKAPVQAPAPAEVPAPETPAQTAK